MTLKLPNLRILTHGSPWYMEYCFKPYDIEKKQPFPELIKKLKKNNQIFAKLRTQDIKIYHLIEKKLLKKKK